MKGCGVTSLLLFTAVRCLMIRPVHRGQTVYASNRIWLPSEETDTDIDRLCTMSYMVS
jgi:hypothetical protein